MKIKTAPFDASSYLDSPEAIAAYINAVLETNDPQLFHLAISTIAKSIGVSVIAERSGLGRESLYKALAPDAKPRYDTILKVISAVGVKLTATPAHA